MKPATDKSKKEQLRRLNDQVERARSFASYMVRNMGDMNEKAEMVAVLDDLKTAKMRLDKITPALNRLWSGLQPVAEVAALNIPHEALMEAVAAVLAQQKGAKGKAK